MIEVDTKKITIRLPLIHGREKTISEIIVTLLTREWPLTMKGIHNRIERSYAKVVSMQAVHKAIQKLLEEKIISRNKSFYRINIDWLNKIQRFSTRLKKEYNLKETNLKNVP
jgi:predicted transcriptional regulator